ncbi:MAG: hypothetical protein IT567_02830 [Alphaproteobacteria bacterium]|nr:hypothetical protein [Alphaproteobacteria bacterium]
MKFLLRVLMACLMAGAYAPAAHAVRIKNMDKESHTFTINNAGEEHSITLGQYDLVNFFGPVVTVTLKDGQSVNARNLDEYVIDHGQLIVQRRRETNSGAR